MKHGSPAPNLLPDNTGGATTWISYRDDTGEHFGVHDADTVIPLAAIQRLNATTPADLLNGAALDREGRRRLDQIMLLPASPHPRKIFGVGVNYRTGAGADTDAAPAYPVLFCKFASNLIAGDADIELPPESGQVDYEGELAVIIGTPGRRIPEADALDHVLGYSVANDITMRDYQSKTQGCPARRGTAPPRCGQGVRQCGISMWAALSASSPLRARSRQVASRASSASASTVRRWSAVSRIALLTVVFASGLV